MRAGQDSYTSGVPFAKGAAKSSELQRLDPAHVIWGPVCFLKAQDVPALVEDESVRSLLTPEPTAVSGEEEEGHGED